MEVQRFSDAFEERESLGLLFYRNSSQKAVPSSQVTNAIVLGQPQHGSKGKAETDEEGNCCAN